MWISKIVLGALLCFSSNVLSSDHSFWNLDCYCLERLCAHLVTHLDEASMEQLGEFFPPLNRSELKKLAQMVLEVKQKIRLFSEEEETLLSKLNLPGLSLSVTWKETASEVDIARSLLLAEFPGNEDLVRHYAISLDIQALRAYVERLRLLRERPCIPGSDLYRRLTIEALNTVLFYEDAFRYPSKQEMFSDAFSLLSYAADAKFGVCLGGASLYLALSQRLDLPLEPVTPPGHIYLRYRQGEVNIETTAGGKHIETSTYCEYTRDSALKVRSTEELVGLTFMNQGSFALQRRDYSKAVESYVRALSYIDDEEVKELLGLSYILLGEEKKGQEFLMNSQTGSLGRDYLEGNVDNATLALLLTYPGSTYAALLDYELQLKAAVEHCPRCRECRRRLASVVLHIGKLAEGVQLLEICAQESPEDISLHLRLCKLLCDRLDYTKAANYLLKIQPLLEKQEVGSSFSLYQEIKRKILRINPIVLDKKR